MSNSSTFEMGDMVQDSIKYDSLWLIEDEVLEKARDKMRKIEHN